MASKLPFPQMKYCVRCCLPETEEGTSLDDSGICRICQSSEQKMHINWLEREKQLRSILNETKSIDAGYDLILPISGGKDSMFQAHVLTKIYGMKPLAVTFSHNWYSEAGFYNLMNCLETFNLDHIQFTPNRELVNKLANSSVPMIGDTCWHCHSGVGAFPLHVAVKFKIPLLVYGESVAENSGRATYNQPIKYDREYFQKISAKKTPAEMIDGEITERDLHMFILPSAEECDVACVKGIHLGDYIFWDHERQTEFVRDVYGWRESEIEGSYKHYKSAECIMPGMHDFTCYLKRGFGRSSIEGSMDVRNGILSREEAFDLIDRTDPIRPDALDYYLEITNQSEHKFFDEMASQCIVPLKAGQSIPVHPKQPSQRVRIRPFVVQLIERYKNESALSKISSKPLDNNIPDIRGEGSLFQELTCRELTAALASRRLTPCDLAKQCISLVKKYNSQYHIFESFDPEILMKEAHYSQELLDQGKQTRVLEGMPVGVKDIYNTIDYPTQMGSSIWKDFQSGNDARLVANIKRAGGLVAGKTVTAEFAVHALNGTLNPHDITRNPGTSSSGAAVSTALGITPISLASQTAGSISRPASYCGVYGYKPSFGLLPRTGTLKTTDSLDTLGYFCTHLIDVPLILDAIRLKGHNYPKLQAAFDDRMRQGKRMGEPWKIALIKTYTWDVAESYAQSSLLKFIQKLSSLKDIEIIEVDLPSSLEKAHDAHAHIYDYSLAYYFQKESEQVEQISDLMVQCIERGRLVSTRQYHQALSDQENMMIVMDELMQDFDAGISLATAGHAPLRESRESPDPSLIWTMTHLPILSVPLFHSPQGMPFGAQFFARKYNDPLLLKLASRLLSLKMIPAGANPIVSDL